MLIIEGRNVIVDGVSHPIPPLPVPVNVKVWTVPTEYRESGVFIAATPDGEPEEYPACANPQFIGEARVEADPAAALAAEKQRKIKDVKQKAAELIESLNWRIERAKERDLLGLPGETVNEVLLEREAIRRASNRCEAEIEAALTVEAVQAVTLQVTDADRATPHRLTRLEFLRRFTDAEMQALLSAAESSPPLKAALLKWQTAEGIVLTDPETIAGVQALEIAGLISAGRAAEVLAVVGHTAS